MSLNHNDRFTINGEQTECRVSDFWNWAYSDLLNNTSRGVLAEFLVHHALHGIEQNHFRSNWMPYDVMSPDGLRIEVKSAAYLQSWKSDFPSRILFDIAPKKAWHPEHGYSNESARHSDLYVFCLYTATSNTQSILNLDLWEFYILPTAVLDEMIPTQKTIGLSSLLHLSPTKVKYSDLASTIATFNKQRGTT